MLLSQQIRSGCLPATRLATYRAKAEECRTTHPHFTMGHDWRYWAKLWPLSHLHRGEDGRIYIDDIEPLGEDIGSAHEIISRAGYRHDTTGYYMDYHQFDTCVPKVAKVRSSKGTLYIPVLTFTDCDGVTFILKDAVLVDKGADENEHESGKVEAARYADRCAEIHAKESREENLKYEAQEQADEQIGAAKELRKRATMLIGEVRAIRKRIKPSVAPAACAALMNTIVGMRREASQCYRRARSWRDNEYNYYNERLYGRYSC